MTPGDQDNKKIRVAVVFGFQKFQHQQPAGKCAAGLASEHGRILQHDHADQQEDDREHRRVLRDVQPVAVAPACGQRPKQCAQYGECDYDHFEATLIAGESAAISPARARTSLSEPNP